jgi:hypothetical protein
MEYREDILHIMTQEEDLFERFCATDYLTQTDLSLQLVALSQQRFELCHKNNDLYFLYQKIYLCLAEEDYHTAAQLRKEIENFQI